MNQRRWRSRLRLRIVVVQAVGLLLLLGACWSVGRVVQVTADLNDQWMHDLEALAPVFVAHQAVHSLGASEAALAGGRERSARLAQLQRTAMHLLIGVAVIGLLGIVLTFWYVTRVMIRPIQMLSRGVEAAGQGAWTPVRIRTGDEIEQLAEVFNRMAAQVQETQQMLEAKVAARTQILESQARALLGQREEMTEINRQMAWEKKAMINLMEDLRQAHDRLKAAQAQLLQSEKLAAIGQLAAGVAHEINNPTGFVLSNLETIREYGRSLQTLVALYQEARQRLADAPADQQALAQWRAAMDATDTPFLLQDLRRAVEESIEGMLRIKRIVQGLRTYAHGDANILTQLNVHEELESAVQLAWNEIRYKAEIVKEYGELPRIWGYAQQLNQVFLNLLVNAAQAIPRKGVIHVRTAAEGDHVTVDISDTGCGMSEEVQRRIFEPFFTTKPVGEGTGLGLSIVYNIVQAHHGTIAVHSAVGQGTTFTITLPVAQPEEASLSADERQALFDKREAQDSGSKDVLHATLHRISNDASRTTSDERRG